VVVRDLPRWRQTILVVEDDDDLREIFAKALRVAGFRVQRAADGAEAVRAIDVEAPDLVVLDLVLPTLDGLALRAAIRAHRDTQRIPMVILTGAADQYAHRLNGDCLLTKPVTPDRLLATVSECLRRSKRE